MSKPFWKSRLTFQLLGSVLLALGIAVCLFFLLQWGGTAALNQITTQSSFQQKQEQACAKRFQDYVMEQGLALTDKAALDTWARREGYVNVSLYQGNRLVYNSTMSEEDILQYAEYQATEDVQEDTLYPWYTYYSVQMKDGEVQAWFSCYYEVRYYSMVDVAAMLIAGLVSILILLLFISQKTRYINRISEEIKILEGGDLSYQMTVRGHDELGALAQGIDDMRRSIIEQRDTEKRAQDANRELITAMSHDLRTPLTALIGYLDLIQLKKYQDEDQLSHFIGNSREKAYQIKAMSDKLFEYFLVYGKEPEQLKLQPVDGLVLLQQIVEDSLFDLESRGFCIVRNFAEIPCILQVNVDFLRRVFDNVFSNIVKYGDASHPVEVSCKEQDGFLQICFSNGLDPEKNREESTGIGLKTCEKILQDHGGSFQAGEREGQFVATIRLPMEKQCEEGALME